MNGLAGQSTAFAPQAVLIVGGSRSKRPGLASMGSREGTANAGWHTGRHAFPENASGFLPATMYVLGTQHTIDCGRPLNHSRSWSSTPVREPRSHRAMTEERSPEGCHGLR